MTTYSIILVEDDDDLRASLADCLGITGLDVTGVANAASFEAAMRERAYHVAAIDLGLPDGDGFEIVERLRRTTSMGVVILTARGRQEDRVRGYDLGTDLYFVKPVDCAELGLAIRNLALRLSSDETGNGGTPWALDRLAWKLATPDGSLVHLTPKEFNFLATLIETPNRQVDRATLLECLDYTNDYSGNRSLDAMIGRLRRKVQDGAGLPLPVKTLHATGFVFTAGVTEIGPGTRAGSRAASRTPAGHHELS